MTDKILLDIVQVLNAHIAYRNKLISNNFDADASILVDIEDLEVLIFHALSSQRKDINS